MTFGVCRGFDFPRPVCCRSFGLALEHHWHCDYNLLKLKRQQIWTVSRIRSYTVLLFKHCSQRSGACSALDQLRDYSVRVRDVMHSFRSPMWRRLQLHLSKYLAPILQNQSGSQNRVVLWNELIYPNQTPNWRQTSLTFYLFFIFKGGIAMFNKR